MRVATPLPAAFSTPDRFGCEIPAIVGTNERGNGFILAGTNIRSAKYNGFCLLDAVSPWGGGRIESARLKEYALAERRVTDEKDTHGDTPAKKPAKSAQADVGIALREAFQAAVNEEVPDELLDLLRRLD